MERRALLKLGIGTVGALWSLKSLGAGEICSLTPRQTEGPFYPITDQHDKDADLIWVDGKSQMAQGEVVIIQGLVTDQNCKPVPGALVEIWQACVTGKYNHVSDPNPAPIDPDFQYWGKAVTKADGSYKFRTIIPGSYPAADGWIRPPHVHFKVTKKAHFELTTQMYFAGQALNDQDLILKSLSPSDQQKVVVDFKQVSGSPAPVGQFNLTIRKVTA